MAEKLFLGGITNTTIAEEDGKIYVHDSVNAEPVLEYVKAANKANAENLVRRDEFTHEAKIPMTVFMEWCREAGVTDMFSEEAMNIYDKKMQDHYYRQAFQIQYANKFF